MDKKIKEQPDTIIPIKLGAILMPNGEIICMGNCIGWFEDLKDYVYEFKNEQ